MSGHTPGPWKVTQHDGKWIVVGSGQPICKLFPGFNGDLIAAAPDLLEALKATFHPNNPEPWDVVEARAKKAIAKAEGRS